MGRALLRPEGPKFEAEGRERGGSLREGAVSLWSDTLKNTPCWGRTCRILGPAKRKKLDENENSQTKLLAGGALPQTNASPDPVVGLSLSAPLALGGLSPLNFWPTVIFSDCVENAFVYQSVTVVLLMQ